jgi:formylglycine-generating enzyme required for sulfatase activity
MINFSTTKKIRRTICVLAVIALLGGCFSPWAGDGATITIHVGAGSSRAIFPPNDATLASISYTVTLQGPSTMTDVPFESGTQTLNLSVTPGSYTITVTAYLDGKVYAKCTTTAEARAGQSTQVDILMQDAREEFIEMVSITAGKFNMGSPTTEANHNSNETDHEVTLMQDFYMGKYQVTQEQYEAVMGSNPSNFKTAVDGESGTPGKLPVENVSWYDALVFCNKLSMAEGLNPVYSISDKTDPAQWEKVPASSSDIWNAVEMISGTNGYRLPTEAEWEYACRAGTTTAYNTGNTISDSTGWYKDNSEDKTHQVGLKTPNAWGLYDMHGNVHEWCWDWHNGSYYSSSPINDPVGPATGSTRVVRGGSWDRDGPILRSASRGDGSPDLRNGSIGFRVVRSSE